MFKRFIKYDETDIVERCGSRDVPIDHSIKPEFTGKFVEVGGEQIPIINYNFQSGVKFTRCLCLLTHLGYIPIKNIKSQKDLYDKSKYLKDDTEWTKPYDEDFAHEKDKEDVKRLSLVLGKRWKPNQTQKTK